jgi:hypothetical protein
MKESYIAAMKLPRLACKTGVEDLTHDPGGILLRRSSSDPVSHSPVKSGLCKKKVAIL